jgi:hypothetical protein
MHNLPRYRTIILYVLASLLLFYVLSEATYEFRGCYWEGCIERYGFPFRYISDWGLGGSHTLYQILFLDVGLIFIGLLIIHYVAKSIFDNLTRRTRSGGADELPGRE